MPRTALGISTESLRLSTRAQTQLCHAHTQALVTSSVLSMTCLKPELWKGRCSQDSQKCQPRSPCWVAVRASLHPCPLSWGSSQPCCPISLLETHRFFPLTVHRLKKISFQRQLNTGSVVLPQLPTDFYPCSTVCPTPDHIKQHDEHLSHEHLSFPFLSPGEN